jgi:hypothetical protein
VLINSVLTSQPLYYMSAFVLPKWVIARLDKIRRCFLWHGHKETLGQSRPIHLANWSVVTRSKEMEGLGIRDLEKMNSALMLKWMWQWISSSHNWWKEATYTFGEHIRPWEMSNTSRFWSSLRALAPIFQSSLQFTIGQGTTIHFWLDNWIQGPLQSRYPSLHSSTRFGDASVADLNQEGLWELSFHDNQEPQFSADKDRLLQELSAMQLVPTPDILVWTRDVSMQFSVKSGYNFLTGTPHIKETVCNLWEIKVPLRVKIFLWLQL